MPQLYLGRYPLASSFSKEVFSPKVRAYLPGPCRSPYWAVVLCSKLTTRSNCSAQMAKFTGSPPAENLSARAFGTRVRVDVGTTFPDEAVVGVAPFRDSEGRPLYVGTAILDDGAIPCQIDPQMFAVKRPTTRKSRQAQPVRQVMISSSMQWIPATYGEIPYGKQPVHGGHENSSPHLYHAIARIGNTFIPGKTSPDLGGALVTYQGEEHFFDSDYYVL
ncbi:unnamed protein product [Rhizoctonia solani]|uniref:Uncharacterized protein n=1 Tax=Rhizoctonia solani TaxID=456999 RepID=A0A8H3D5G4_9AGAM|nr:unnamed protein product [Rhizoctonia solani]